MQLYVAARIAWLTYWAVHWALTLVAEIQYPEPWVLLFCYFTERFQNDCIISGKFRLRKFYARSCSFGCSRNQCNMKEELAGQYGAIHHQCSTLLSCRYRCLRRSIILICFFAFGHRFTPIKSIIHPVCLSFLRWIRGSVQVPAQTQMT